MKRLLPLLLPLALTGCIKSEPSAVAPKADRVYTVNEFLAQPELRKKFFAMCSNDPGQTERNPNCVNVFSAERVASFGTTIPRTAP